MTIYRLLVAAYLAILLAPVSAFAADSQGNFTVLSFGTKSCGTVVADFDNKGWEKLTNGAWVAGYLTAFNKDVFVGQDVAKGTDPAARDLWIYNYCKANPLDTLFRATEALVEELGLRIR